MKADLPISVQCAFGLAIMPNGIDLGRYLCQTGVAASRQRAALFNLLLKCGGLPTAATMKGADGAPWI
jgi:hypothetical protein